MYSHYIRQNLIKTNNQTRQPTKQMSPPTNWPWPAPRKCRVTEIKDRIGRTLLDSVFQSCEGQLSGAGGKLSGRVPAQPAGGPGFTPQHDKTRDSFLCRTHHSKQRSAQGLPLGTVQRLLQRLSHSTDVGSLESMCSGDPGLVQIPGNGSLPAAPLQPQP